MFQTHNLKLAKKLFNLKSFVEKLLNKIPKIILDNNINSSKIDFIKTK